MWDVTEQQVLVQNLVQMIHRIVKCRISVSQMSGVRRISPNSFPKSNCPKQEFDIFGISPSQKISILSSLSTLDLSTWFAFSGWFHKAAHFLKSEYDIIYIYIYTVKTLVYYFCKGEFSCVWNVLQILCVAIGHPPKAIPITVHDVHISSCFAQSCVRARGEIIAIPSRYPFVQKLAPDHI